MGPGGGARLSGYRAAYIRQECLDEAMVKALRSLRLDREVVTWVKNALVESASDERRFHSEAIARPQ